MPIGVSPAIMTNSRTCVLIEVTLITAPNVELRELKIDGRPARLSDFGDPPFRLVTRHHMLGYREITRTTNNTKVDTSMIEMYRNGIVPHAPDVSADNQPYDGITDGVHMETKAQVIVDGKSDELPRDMSLSVYNIYQNCQE
jgi:hypothetical protein